MGTFIVVYYGGTGYRYYDKHHFPKAYHYVHRRPSYTCYPTYYHHPRVVYHYPRYHYPRYHYGYHYGRHHHKHGVHFGYRSHGYGHSYGHVGYVYRAGGSKFHIGVRF